MATYSLNINQKTIKVDAEADTPLLWVLRDHLQMTGTKYGCGKALCGACTIHLNGNAVRACSLPVSAIGSSKITTIEGLAGTISGGSDQLHPVQKAWIEEDVPQCGYCQCGQIMSASALLAKNPQPTDEAIDAAMSGNICRCGTYTRVRKAIHRAAKEMK